MDFSIWSILQAKVLTKKYETVDALKIALRREWGKIPSDHIRAACEAFSDRLDAIIRAKGGYMKFWNKKNKNWQIYSIFNW